MSKVESLVLEEKQLSDFDLNHIVYISVGPHLNETLNEIIERKGKEVRDCKESLWAFSSGISETVFELCNKYREKDDYLYCIMIDTGKDTKTKTGKKAKYYERLDGEYIKIPKGMEVTFAKNGDYALLVDQYYKIIGDNVLYLKEYDYNQQYKYIRGFGFLNKVERDIDSIKNKKKCLPKEVSYIAKLKKPFLVKIFERNPNEA